MRTITALLILSATLASGADPGVITLTGSPVRVLPPTVSLRQGLPQAKVGDPVTAGQIVQGQLMKTKAQRKARMLPGQVQNQIIRMQHHQLRIRNPERTVVYQMRKMECQQMRKLHREHQREMCQIHLTARHQGCRMMLPQL